MRFDTNNILPFSLADGYGNNSQAFLYNGR